MADSNAGQTLADDLAALRVAMKPAFDAEAAEWKHHGPAAKSRLEATGASLDYLGGNCPVQAEGTVDGQPYYFRARGNAWELWIGQSADWWSDRAWSIERDYGSWPDAGWMPRHEALGFIVEGVVAYRARAAEPCPPSVAL